MYPAHVDTVFFLLGAAQFHVIDQIAEVVVVSGSFGGSVGFFGFEVLGEVRTRGLRGEGFL